MRARSDAILVGLATVLADDPQLTCRLEGLETWSPVRVVLDTRAQLPLSTCLAQTADITPVWLIVGETAAGERIEKLKSCGIKVLTCAQANGRIVPDQAFSLLARRGISRVLVEGGAKLSRSLVSEGLIDEVAIFISPKTLGPQGLNALGDVPLSAITQSADFRLVETMMLEHDHLTRYIRQNQD